MTRKEYIRQKQEKATERNRLRRIKRMNKLALQKKVSNE